jgi:DNA-binding CsgD family transcriptional regulator
VNEASVSELLDLIYGSVIEPDLWISVIERICDGTGGHSGWLSQLNVANGDAAGVLARVDPALVPRYFEHYAFVNPFTKFARLHDKSVRWTPRVMVDDEQFPREFLLRTEYYNDHMVPARANHVLMIDLAAQGDEVVTVNIGRSANRGRFEAEDLRAAETLLPHLIRAFKLSGVFSGVKDLNDSRASALDRTRRGIFITDAACRVRYVNHLGEAIMARRDCLRIAGGRLVAISADATKRLHSLIGRAASIDPAVRTGGSMALPSSIGHPLSVIVVPLKRAPVFTREASAIVAIADLTADLTISDQRLREFFMLTAAEARVTRYLFEGSTPGEIADRSGVSLATVRAQLASVYAKTGTAGQAELLRLLMRINDGLSDGVLS